MADAVWCIMPVLAGPQMTEAAISDLLAQSVPTKILIVNQGVDDPFRRHLERISEEYPDRVFVWSHVPPLPSLSATWNRALQFCWECGADEAVVTNSDVRLHRRMLELLTRTRDLTEALFITGVGVTAEDFAKAQDYLDTAVNGHLQEQRGGPDFSCFLTTREGHEKYPFDEMFVPAFLEDLDCHRRYLLGGDGHRIFSVNVPYNHIGGGSQTLKSMTPERRASTEAAISLGSRVHYRRKWLGDANTERLTIPFDESTAQDGVTTPELQNACLRSDADPRDVSCTATLDS